MLLSKLLWFALTVEKVFTLSLKNAIKLFKASMSRRGWGSSAPNEPPLDPP